MPGIQIFCMYYSYIQRLHAVFQELSTTIVIEMEELDCSGGRSSAAMVFTRINLTQEAPALDTH